MCACACACMQCLSSFPESVSPESWDRSTRRRSPEWVHSFCVPCVNCLFYTNRKWTFCWYLKWAEELLWQYIPVTVVLWYHHQLTEEKRALDEEERRASEEFIQRLLAEEEQLQQEEMRRSEDDEKLARLLSNQLVSVPSLRVIGGLVRVENVNVKGFCLEVSQPQHSRASVAMMKAGLRLQEL